MSQLRHTAHRPHPQERMMPPCTPHPGGTMQRRTITIISAAAVAVAAAITGLIVWLSQPSYDDLVKDCQKAIAVQLDADGEDKGQPDACRDVKDDDFNAVLMHEILGNEGWLGEDGKFDENKMLEDTLNDMP